MSLTALAFVLVFLSGCLLAFVRRPIFGLLTYVAVFYVHPPSRWWGQGLLLEVRWAFLAAGATLLALMIRKPAGPVAPVFRSGAFWAFVAFVVWIGVQWFWALDRETHFDQIVLYVKFVLVIIMVCRCIETKEDLRWFLWTHVLGCFYLGWLAFTSYSGGRLDGVGGPGIDEANAAALQIVTGIFIAASLFLAGSLRTRIGLLGLLPIMVNALVTTISRSGFLAAAVGGVIYNLFTPSKYRREVRVLSALALILFALLTNDLYWDRINTIKYKGAEVEGVDTGGGRLEVMQAQWRMFLGHPLGCGHMCTTVLSPSYVDERFMSAQGGRASHNTFMTMLVDHGVVGATFYIAMLVWLYRSLRSIARKLRGQEGLLPMILPGVAGALSAITVADLFVQYPKYEARFWLVATVIVLLHLTERIERANENSC